MKENLAQPQVPVPSKRFPVKWISIVVFIIAIFSAGILFAPIPYYQKETLFCIQIVGHKCPVKGWNLGPSLWQRISSGFPSRQSVEQLSTPQTSPSPTSTEGKFCGGIANIECSSGYTCQPNGSYPGAGGKCVKE